jgi:hypothetical protein
MALSEPVLSGPGAGRTVTYSSRSSGELTLAGEQSGGDRAVVEWRVRAGEEPPMHTHTREGETLYSGKGADHQQSGMARRRARAPRDVRCLCP